MEKKERDGLDLRLGNFFLPSVKEITTSARPPRSFATGMPGMSKRPHRKCKSLVTLCTEKLGRHLEEIVDEVPLFAPTCPSAVKACLLAIARRKGLMSDSLLVALADESWEQLDVSGSEVTDASIQRIAAVCSRLQAVDISRCYQLTPHAVQCLVQHCPDIHTIRWGGTLLSDRTAKSALGYILPKLNLNEEAEDSWEELDSKSIGKGAQALRWLVWPTIDSKSTLRLEMECPRVVINPKSLSKKVPWEARPESVLDSSSVEEIDPQLWAVTRSIRRNNIQSDNSPLLSVAERFKLAYASRNERLAPKRAKNMRQNQRRSEKAWLKSDTDAKSRVWEGIARKSLKGLEG